MSLKSSLGSAFHAIAEFQTRVVLTLVYVVLTPVGLYLRFTDPLKKHARDLPTRWETRTIEAGGKEWFRRMF